MKNRLLMISVVLLLVVGMTGCFKFGDNDSSKFKEEYESLNGKLNEDGTKTNIEVRIPKENPIKYSTYEEIDKILDSGTGVIVFGFPECPWCRNAIPELLEVANDLELGTIYYLDNRNDRDIRTLNEDGTIKVEKEGTEAYNKLLNKLGDNASVYEDLNDTTIKRIYFPTVVFVLKGEVIGVHVATVDSQEDPYIKMTVEQKEELQLIYKENILKVLETACDEGC